MRATIGRAFCDDVDDDDNISQSVAIDNKTRSRRVRLKTLTIAATIQDWTY